MNKILYVLIFIVFSISNSNAQVPLVDEWEASIGYLNFKGDFGERNNFTSNFGSNGGVIAAKVYLNLADYTKYGCYSCSHIKYNITFSGGYSNLSYDGAYENMNTLSAFKLKAVSGQVYFADFSVNTELHITDLRNIDYFASGFLHKLDPYFGVGAGYSFYQVDIESAFGNYEKDPSILPDPLKGGVFSGFGTAPNVNIELGMRYRFNETMQFVFSNKWKYYFSDKVDGLVPDPTQVENKYNDWFYTPSFGVVIFIY